MPDAVEAAPIRMYALLCEPKIGTLSTSSPNTILMVHGKLNHTPNPASSAGVNVNCSLIHMSRVTSMIPSAP